VSSVYWAYLAHGKDSWEYGNDTLS
jgi:hypothetical protein